jgi:hypothetical protein
MTPSPTNSKLVLREGLLDLLWRQWAALGVAGNPNSGADWCVDLEALVLITTTQGRSDPRLFDEMLDWLWGNAQWVNVQRLRNIRKRLPLGDERVLAAIADWLSQRATLSKWKPLAATAPPVPTIPQRLFSTKDGSPQPMVGVSDPVFLRHGLVRGPIERRELSRPPNPRAAAVLPWKLRSLFGVQARCEFLLWLLTHESGHPADIARGTYYFPRTVEETLKELAASGLVHTARPGRETRYWLKPDDWRFLRTWTKPEGFPRWIDWPRFFTAQEQIIAVLDNDDLSPLLQASELRRVFEELQPVLADGRLLPAFVASRNHTGVQFTEALLQDLRELFGQL